MQQEPTVPDASRPTGDERLLAGVQRFLRPGDRQVIIIRRSPAKLINPLFAVIGSLLVVGVLSRTTLQHNGSGILIAWVIWLMFFLHFWWQTTQWFVDYFVATPDRILLVSGFLKRKSSELPVGKVIDLSLRRSFGGRIFGYGELTFETVGQNETLRAVDYAPYPEQLVIELRKTIFPSM